MKLQFVNADNLLPGAVMTKDIARRLVSLYNPYTGASLSTSSTLEDIVRLSSGFIASSIEMRMEHSQVQKVLTHRYLDT